MTQGPATDCETEEQASDDERGPEYRFMAVHDIERAQQALDFAVEAWLRDKGWKHTSTTPGCFWLWERKLDDGRTVLVERAMAVKMQDELTPVPRETSESTERWGWATHPDADFWHGAGSRQEAIDSARAEAGPGRDVWIHMGVRADAGNCVPAWEQFCDQMDSDAADNGCPEEIDDAFDFADGAQEALEGALAAWAERYVKANWWEAVGGSECIPAEAGHQTAVERCEVNVTT